MTINGVVGLHCILCREVVGVVNATAADQPYVCHACRTELALDWSEPLLARAEDLNLFSYPGLEMCAAQQQVLLHIIGSTMQPRDRIAFAAEVVLWAVVAQVQGQITAGDVVAIRDEMAALCGLLPSELIADAQALFQPQEAIAWTSR